MSESATSTRTTDPRAESLNLRAFDRWSESYDAVSNPLLALERRYLGAILPPLAGRRVLDAGCGSGRWLEYLAGGRPLGLAGADLSPGMLRAAARKGLPGVDLVCCSCDRTPFAGGSFDLVLALFLLSYVDNLEGFAWEMSRVTGEGADLFLSDMHPETELRLGWRRSFRDGGGMVQLETVCRSIERTVQVFEASGWELRAALEPGFGAAEREIFAACGRLEHLEQARGYPAVYLLHLARRPRAGRERGEDSGPGRISGARCALGPAESTRAELELRSGRIARMTVDRLTARAARAPEPAAAIDLSGYLLMPGLVNAHDHLEFALFPRLGLPPYPNATAWSRDIHERYPELIERMRQVPRDVRLWWGGLRNLLSGVTTVCHHNPAEPELEREDYPVRVVREYRWAHSLAFGADIAGAHAAGPSGSPFLIHAGEGIDDEARGELAALDRMGVLDQRTVIIHGVALGAAEIRLLAGRGTGLILCPSSNHFLFERTAELELLREFEPVALGSDSPLTAEGDLLDEIRFAVNACGVPPHRIYAMVTATAAELLRLGGCEGSIRVPARADLVAIRDNGQDPAERLRALTASDVEFVMVGGRVQLASREVRNRLPVDLAAGLEPVQVGDFLRWLRAPVRELLERTEPVLGSGAVRLGRYRISLPAKGEVADAV